MNITKSVPGVGRSSLLAQRLVQREGLPRVAGCQLKVTEQGVTPADSVQGSGFSRLVMAAPIEVQRMPGVTERFWDTAFLFHNYGKADVGMSLLDEVGELAVYH